MARIDLGKLSDRELLILAVNTINDVVTRLDILNNAVAKNTAFRIATEAGGSNCDSSKKHIAKWQIIAGTITLLLAIVFAIGKGAGWW